ncbi:MAG: anion transporter [Myxococcaceae bacterium]|nr:anion transporter [Myxococcaceae bacterium]
MTTEVVAVFVIVYFGMFLGELPKLQLDRTGIALLGALVLIGTGAVSLEAAQRSLDVGTLALLFGLMVLSAQLRLGGFYTAVTARLVALDASPSRFLLLLVLAVGALSAIFTNDVVCLAVTPVVIAACVNRGLDPRPFAIGAACASNIGSAATLIGNPQNMLIGQALKLSFPRYLAQAAVPSALGLVAAWGLIVVLVRGRWAQPVEPVALGADEPANTAAAASAVLSAPRPFNPWQSAKGLLIAMLLMVAFCVSPWPRDVLALGAAGLMLMSRRLHSRDMLGLVDWSLLVMFAGLFVVNGALEHTGLTAKAIAALPGLSEPYALFGASVVLSNIVSNVPAVMLLLPAATHALAGPSLALASTLAGNLIIVGSIANIIVVESAKAHGVTIDWKTHARIGVPVTLATLAIAAVWLELMT